MRQALQEVAALASLSADVRESSNGLGSLSRSAPIVKRSSRSSPMPSLES